MTPRESVSAAVERLAVAAEKHGWYLELTAGPFVKGKERRSIGRLRVMDAHREIVGANVNGKPLAVVAAALLKELKGPA